MLWGIETLEVTVIMGLCRHIVVVQWQLVTFLLHSLSQSYDWNEELSSQEMFHCFRYSVPTGGYLKTKLIGHIYTVHSLSIDTLLSEIGPPSIESIHGLKKINHIVDFFWNQVHKIVQRQFIDLLNNFKLAWTLWRILNCLFGKRN